MSLDFGSKEKCGFSNVYSDQFLLAIYFTALRNLKKVEIQKGIFKPFCL